MNWFRQTRASQYDDAIRRADLRVDEFREGALMLTTAGTLIAGKDKRFLYTVKFCRIGDSPNFEPAANADDTRTFSALSVSELTNTTLPYSYGVAKANIPAGFAAVKIPDNTAVWCVPHRTADGTFIWLIVNTQAIDGVCT